MAPSRTTGELGCTKCSATLQAQAGKDHSRFRDLAPCARDAAPLKRLVCGEDECLTVRATLPRPAERALVRFWPTLWATGKPMASVSPRRPRLAWPGESGHRGRPFPQIRRARPP